jgi:outer membrane protein assembly factor BamB
MNKFILIGVAGIFILGVMYNFRHRIMHFRLRFVSHKVESITLSPAYLKLPKGSAGKITAIVRYRDNHVEEVSSNLTWSISPSGIVEISPEGLISARQVGTATLQVTLGGGKALASIEVSPVAPVALAISPANELIPVGGKVQYKVLVISSDNTSSDVTRTVSFHVSNPDAIKLLSGGAGIGQAEGESSVRASLPTPLGAIEISTMVTVAPRSDAISGIYSYRYDNSRTGQNRAETELTTMNVNAASFGKVFSASVDGYVYAQPLYVSGVSIPGHSQHDVVYVATENNWVYALDAASGEVLFSKSLGLTDPNESRPCGDMGPHIGVTGTPVIDPRTKTLYVAARSWEDGKNNFRLHALDISTGTERSRSPVVIAAALPGSGAGSQGGVVSFEPTLQLQRPGLALANGQVYIAFGSVCDHGAYHGWLFSYDAVTFGQTGVLLTTPGAHHGGIWQAGAAPAVDPEGNVYVITGDGDFDADMGGTDFGDSFLRLRLTSTKRFAVVDYFTPYNENDLDVENVDLGGSGPILIPDQVNQHSHLLLGSGKNGAVYLLDRDRLGHFQGSSNSQIVQYIPDAVPGLVHTTPAYWQNQNGQWVFIGSVKGSLEAFALKDGRINPRPSSKTSTIFSYPGAMPVISSKGNENGIVWALDDTPGVLHAYDATDLSRELYNAGQAGGDRDRSEPGVHFYTPLVANGRVYFGTRNRIYCYGLLR